MSNKILRSAYNYEPLCSAVFVHYTRKTVFSPARSDIRVRDRTENDPLAVDQHLKRIAHALIAVARAEVGLVVLGRCVRATGCLRGDLAVHVAAAALDRADLSRRLVQRVIHHHHHRRVRHRTVLRGVGERRSVIRALCAYACIFAVFCRISAAAAGQRKRKQQREY